MCLQESHWHSYGFGISGTDYVVVATSVNDIVGMINEVPSNQTANVIALPLHLEQGNAVGYFAARPIQSHTELLTHYGRTYDRDYTVGRPAPRLRHEESVHEAFRVRNYHTFCAKRKKN